MLNFKQFMEETDLSYLLAPPSTVLQIGKEKTVSETNDGICEYVSREGSYRYVYKIEGLAVSVLQVVSKEKGRAIMSNIYTLPEFRRHHLATKLYTHAKARFTTLDDPAQFSDLGQTWRKNVD